MVPTSLVRELAEFIGPRYRCMVLLAGFAGLRTGESLGLRRADVDLLHGEVHVECQAQELAGIGRYVDAPKSEAGRRVIALPAIVVDSLGDHLATFGSAEADSPVFTGPEGGPLRRATFSNAWTGATKVTGAPAGLWPHDLRHHAATLTARMPGVTTKELMARIGRLTPGRADLPARQRRTATGPSHPSSTTSWRRLFRPSGRRSWISPPRPAGCRGVGRVEGAPPGGRHPF